EVREMRDKYEGLLFLVANAQQRAAEFSDAFRQLSSFVAGAFGAIEDGNVGEVFQHVAVVEERIGQLFHYYAMHLAQAIAEPTESLLVEIHQVEETRKLYEAK
ncbi:unnamed protein product, partial [Closterium sp. NIES-53]